MVSSALKGYRPGETERARRRQLALTVVAVQRQQKTEVGRRMEAALDNWFGSLADRVISRVYDQARAVTRKQMSRKAVEAELLPLPEYGMPPPDYEVQSPGTVLAEAINARELLNKQDTLELENLSKRFYTELIAYSWDTWNLQTGMAVDFALTDPAVTAALAGAGTRVKGIQETTLGVLQESAQAAARAGWSVDHWVRGDPANGIKGLRDIVEQTYKNRARAIARTELGTAQNTAAANRFEAAGVTKVLCLDNGVDDSAPGCVILGAGGKGTVVPIEWSKAHALGHPNCLRCFAAEFDAPVDESTLQKWGETGDWGVSEGDMPMDISGYDSDYKKITSAQKVGQANAKDIRGQMERDLAGIRQEGGIFGPQVDVRGPLDPDKVERIGDNARGEIGKYANYLAGDTTQLLNNFVVRMERDLTKGLSEFRGIDAKDVDAMLRDSIRKLVYQEIESNRQQFTDHGIRHIVKNIQTQNDVLDALESQGIKTTARERLLANFAMINHDVGYTTPLTRAGGFRGILASGDHKLFGAKIIEEQRGIWNEGKVFTSQEYDRVVHLVRTHDDVALDPGDHLALATRIADNMALFQADKLPSMFKYVKDGDKYLVQMGEAAKAGNDVAFEQARTDLRYAIRTSELSPALQRDLVAATGEITKMTPKFALGTLAGDTISITKLPGGMIGVKIKFNEYDAFLQEHFDMGQKQVKKLLESYGVTDFTKTHYELGSFNGKPVLVIDVAGVKGLSALDYRPSARTLTAVRANVDGFIKTAAKGLDISEAEVALRVTKALKKWIDANPISIRRGRRGTEGIADTGRFMTQFETGSSSGMFNPTYRKEAESLGLGAPHSLDDKKRPVYGYIHTPDNSATAYGPIEFQLKPEVKNRATFTVEDSLGSFKSRYATGAPLTEPGAKEAWDGNVYGLAEGKPPWSYLEVQVQGGVMLDDVQKIVVHHSAWIIGPDGTPRVDYGFYEAIEALKAAGVEVEYADTD